MKCPPSSLVINSIFAQNKVKKDAHIQYVNKEGILNFTQFDV